MNDGTAEIIQLFGARPKPGKKISARSEPASRIPQPQSEEVASDTCSNQRLRAKRRDIWREADAVMDYWHLSLKMDSAIFRVQTSRHAGRRYAFSLQAGGSLDAGREISRSMGAPNAYARHRMLKPSYGNGRNSRPKITSIPI
jgi:hypothetical protein